MNQHIMIAIPTEDDLLAPFYEWCKRFDWNNVGQVDLVHIVKINITPLEFGLVEVPTTNAFLEMLPTLENFLKDEGKKIVPAHLLDRTSYLIESHYYPEDRIIELSKQRGTDMVIVSTIERHGLDGFFHHSFSEHLIKNAQCDIFVVKGAPGA